MPALRIFCAAPPAPMCAVYRAMAIIGVDGFSALPAHCLQLCALFFLAAIGEP